MEDIRVKGHNGLVRDPITNAIINVNKSAHEEYISQRDLRQKEQQKLQLLETEVATIKDDLDEIKFLLRRLANGSW